MRVLYRNKSEQHELTVYDTNRLYGEKGRFRVLEFSNAAVQGAIDLDTPARMVLEYPRAMVHLMERNNSEFDSVFVVGHGIGTLPTYLSDRQVKVAELDEEVAELSQTFFGYNGSPVLIGDGRELLEQEPAGTYDYIIIDAFSATGTPEQFTSSSFFAMVKDKLDSDGSVILNVFGRAGSDPLVNAIYTTLQGQFAHTRAFALPTETADEVQNRILMGSNHPIEFQIRHMAGFVEQEPEEGYIIMD
ncbi:spermidine synthase [Paenibacillus sp. PCH8]|uniref:spermidine synthase n=1 Tax=Paenibacillus sp. PCH8 TaxID=2066524 RepID=UPI000CF8A833|nr:fused MFS/spermidine synthase [Paenibacillus sp. PCH8]PQP82342.1 spermidine synthase [Paenibacillus sp. PCH8]